jgi:dipeptidyl aminopeptidase/acylaminoacyl peptidase
MNRILCICLLAATPGWCATVSRPALLYDGIPAQAPEPARLDDYLAARQARPQGFSPQGQLLVMTRFADTDQLHLVEAAAGDRHQLTFLREPVLAGAFSPDPLRRAFLYLAQPAGGGAAQLYYQRLADAHPDGAARLLSDGKSRVGAPLWSNFGREIAFSSDARDGLSSDIDIVDPEAGSLPRLALAGDAAAWYPLDWSPDDRKLLVLKRVSESESYLYVVDVAAGARREVEPAPGRVRIVDARFSRDGQGVYLISDRDGEFAQLRYVNLFTGEKNVLSGHLPWDVENLAISRDGHYLAYVTDQAGAARLNLLDLRARQELTPPPLPGAGVIDSLSFDIPGKRLAFGCGAPNRPRDAFVLDLESNQLKAWTRSEVGAVDPSRFVMPRLAQFPTFDRPDGRPRQLPVSVYEPSERRPHPVLIVLGGGPGRQVRPAFDPWVQYLVNEMGFAVLEPDLRGAAGFGRSFRALDGGNLREDAVKDIGALLVWLGAQGDLDAKRVVVSGTGEGGYLALAALVNFGDRLRGAVEAGGMVDLPDYVGGAPRLQAWRRAEFGDERDPDTRAFLRRISPLSGADRISRPVLVVHGRNDDLVPVAGAQQLVNRLRARGVETWFLSAEDEGAEFMRKSSRDAYLRTFAQFLDRLLRDPAAAPGAAARP